MKHRERKWNSNNNRAGMNSWIENICNQVGESMHSIVAILALTKTLNFHSTFSINENIHPCVPLSRVLTFESLFLYISYFHFPNVKLQWKKSILIFLLLTCLLVEHSVTSKIIKTAQGFNEQECIISTQLAVFTAS